MLKCPGPETHQFPGAADVKHECYGKLSVKSVLKLIAVDQLSLLIDYKGNQIGCIGHCPQLCDLPL